MSMIAGEGEIPVRGDFRQFEEDARKAGKKVTDQLSRDVNDGIKKDKGFSKSGEHIGKEVSDGANRSISSGFKKIAGLAAGFLVVNQVGQAIASAFEEAREAQKIGRLTEQVIKTTGGAAKVTAKEVGTLAEQLSNVSAVDDEIIQGGANLLLTFKNVRNEVGKGNNIFDQTVGLANDMSIALGQDMKSSSIQLGKALNDPIKGVTALQRVGVSFTQQQKDQIKAMTESGDLLGAQKLILKEVGDQFGGAAQAAADPVEKLKVVWGNLLEDLGTRALPLIETIATWLGKNLPKILDGAGKAFGFLGDVLAPVVRWLTNVWETGKNVVEFFRLGGGDAQVFGEILTQTFGLKSQKVFETLYKVVASTYHFIVDTVIPGIKAAIDSFMDGFRGEGGPGSFFTDLGEAAAGFVRVFQEDVMPILRAVASFIMDNLKPILIGLGVAFALLLGPVTLLVGGFIYAYQKFDWFRTGVGIFMDYVKLHVTTVIDVVVAAFKGLVWIIDTIVLPIFDKFMGFVVNFVAPLVAAVFRDIIAPAISFVADATKNMWATIQPILQTVIDFVRDKLGPVWEGMRLVAKAAFDALPGVIGAALRAVGSIVAGFLDGVGSIADAIGLDDIAKVLRSGATSARGWGHSTSNATGVGQGGVSVVGGIRRAMGGPIPGHHNRDDVPIYATPGEFVIKKDSVKKYGMGFMEALNAGHFAAGGLIPNPLDKIRGLADGVIDKARGLGTAALSRVWPTLPVPGNMLGIPPGGANYLRGGVLDLIRRKESETLSGGGGFSRAGGGGPAGSYTAGMLKARAAIQAMFGPLAVGGYANRNIAGTNQKSAHGLWRAWDFMVGLGNVGKGNAIARHLIANASSYGLKGLIWNAMKNFGGGWAPYGHPGGFRDATSQHLDHVHAEFFRRGGAVMPTVHKVPWDSGGVAAPGWNLFNNTTGGPEPLRPTGDAPLIGVVNVYDDADADEMIRRLEFSFAGGGF